MSHAKTLARIGAALFALSIGTASAFAQHAAKGNTPDDATVNAAGQTVAVDKNGKLRKPTQEEINVLVQGMHLNDSPEGLTTKTVGNGSVVMDLQGRFENATVAKINPDGTLSTACVTNAKQAKAFLTADTTKTTKTTKQGTTAAPKLEEK